MEEWVRVVLTFAGGSKKFIKMLSVIKMCFKGGVKFVWM